MKKIALIGFGRFGKLITKFIYKDFEICVFDNKLTKKKLDVWKKKNINGKSNIELLNEKDISKISIVLLCVPISSVKEVAKKINKYLNDETLIIDFCSVKLYPLKVLKRYLKKSIYILGTHPLFGPDSVSDSLNGKKIVLCPERIPESLFEKVHKYLSKFKLKIIISSAKDHDKRTAYTLCLTQFIGRGLEKFHMKEEEFDTLTFNELLHIKNVVLNDTNQLFYDMQIYNPYAKKMRKKLLKDFNDVERKLITK